MGFVWSGQINQKHDIALDKMGVEVSFFGRINSAKHVEVMEEVLLPCVDDKFGRKCLCQQDNCTVHVSRLSKLFFCNQKMALMCWRVCSPELSLMENAWSCISSQVHKQGRKHASSKALELAIHDAWCNTPQSFLDALIESIDNRCVDLLKKKGRRINY